MKTNKKFMTTKTIVLGAVMTALVIVLQSIASFLPNFFGSFSGAIALVPIIIGAALCGPYIGIWLGFVFAVVVLFTAPDAHFFMTIDPFATILIVVLKGTLCGLVSATIYRLFSKINDILGAVCASIICPIVNSGTFLLGALLMLTDNITEITNGSESGLFATLAFFWAAITANFLFELGMCAVLSPVIVKLLSIRKRMH